MNPFQFQIELGRQWMAFANEAVEMASAFYVTASRQMMEQWPGNTGVTASPFMMPWSTSFLTPPWPMNIPAMMQPLSVMWPAPQATPTLWAFNPFDQSHNLHQMWCYASPFTAQTPMTSVNDFYRSSAALVDQAATAYRSASGYAVAAILHAPLDSPGNRAVGFPFTF